MLNEHIWQTELQYRQGNARNIQGFRDGAARTAHDGALFHGHQCIVLRSHLQQQIHVERLGPAHVDNGGVQRFSRLQCGVQQGAEGQDGHTRRGEVIRCQAFTADLPLAEGQAFERSQWGHTGAAAARVTHGNRVVLFKSRAEQLAALALIRRASHAHVGNAAHKRNVVRTRVRRAISAHQPRAVQCEYDGQVLQGHVVDQLIVRTLQEGGIDCHDRLHAFTRHAGSKRHRMLLGNANVVVPIREALFKLHHARAFAHRGRDAHQSAILRSHVAQPLTKHLGEGLLGCSRAFDQAHGRVELARAVVSHRVCLGQLVALPFFGDDVQELRALEALDVLQRGDQRVQVVPVNGADVVEAELFKQRGWHHHALGLLFKALGQLQQRRNRPQHGLAHILGSRVELAAHELGQVAVERTHGWADAHVVVVQDDQQVRIGHATVVQGFKGHACSHGAIANDGHGVTIFPLALGSHGHAQRRRNAGAGVRRAKGVVRALSPLRKTRDTAQLAQRVHAVTAAGEDLVGIGLVAHVPHQAVFRGVEHMVQGHGQLHRSQVGAEVPAGLRNALQYKTTQLGGQHLEVCPGQFAHVCRIVDGLQQGVGSRGHLLFF